MSEYRIINQIGIKPNRPNAYRWLLSPNRVQIVSFSLAT